MNYDKIFQERLEELKREGNYRIFADLERYKGSFPRAKSVVQELAEQEISQGQIIITFCLNRNWQTFMGKTQLCFLPLVMSLTGRRFRS